MESIFGPSHAFSDGRLILTLTEAEEGGYVVTSPMDPELITQAETIVEAFELAYEIKDELADLTSKCRSRH